MARGWESKAVDDQIAAAEAARAERGRPEREAATRERASRLDAVRMHRARTQQLLQMTCDRRHRALLEQTLADLETELSTLED